ncbi:flavodoxin family protein [Microbulbifer sp. GL-2]|uniref:flavodoxin family protein n=1 Tax=Microbulbifer sp. GL-2 TaxID=2591606 RepID=UPI00116427E1|nr:flavodoxin family protein [Microbulbifer sp. GL-2]BBM03709.1 flavodoxin [Microbulbifer sp. GL-2]
MSKVGVVYHSVCDSTRGLAQAVVEGVNNVSGCEGVELTILGEDIQLGRYRNSELMVQLDRCKAIVLGSPTFMGCVSAQFKAFMDTASERYSDRSWMDKLAAGFTIGGNFSGDQLNTIQTMQIFAAQTGMLWAPLGILTDSEGKGRNRGGCQSGLVAVAERDGGLHQLDLLTAQYLGERVGGLSLRLLPH